MPGEEEGTVSRAQRRYFDQKGNFSQRHAESLEQELVDEVLKAIDMDTRRTTARKSALATARNAVLHPLVTQRPKAQRWTKRVDDWKNDSNDVIKDTHDAWADVEQNGADLYAEYQQQRLGLPPTAQTQSERSPHRLGSGLMSEKERAYHLERQLEHRERKLKDRFKAQVKEDRAVEQHAEKTAALEWYHKQRERQKTPLKSGERKAVQQRLYAVHAKPKTARVYG